MGNVKKVRFKLAWQTYRVGDVIQPNGTLRDWLVANGYVDVIDEPLHPTSSPADRMIRKGSKRGRVNGSQNRLV